MKEVTNGRQLLRGALALAGVARPFVRLAGRDVVAYDRKVSELRQWERKASDLESVPDRFNNLFGDRGWIMYEEMNFELATACVRKAEAGEIERAENDLVDAITPDHIRWGLMHMRGIRAFEPRLPLAEKALVDYAEGRYYASVLVTLSLLDGLVNDLHHRQVGFFATGVDLDAWDSVSAHSTGLGRLSRLMQEPRNRTRSDRIAVPYRHGIIHGRDLGYDNKAVAAKSWSVLFAVREWALKAEQKRLGPPAPKPQRGFWQSLRHYAERSKENDALQALLSQWRPRTFEVGRDHATTGEPLDYAEGSPERAALEFFAMLRKRNYGGIVRVLDPTFVNDIGVNRLAGEYRARFAKMSIGEVGLVRIIDHAPAISIITVKVAGEYRGEAFEKEMDLRLVYRSDSRAVLPRGAVGGAWRLVFLPPLPMEPSEDDP